jgi:hypothetical protein
VTPKPKPRKLSKAQVIAWATAEIAVTQAKAAWDKAKEKAEGLRAKYEPRLEPSTDPKDAGKDVKVVRAGGWQIRFSRYATGEYFSLKDYRANGGRITPSMQPHVHRGAGVRVSVKRLDGPTKPGAVEPAS